MSLLTKELARIDIIAEPDSEECIIAGQTGALKGTKSGESIVVGAVDVSVGLWTRVAGQPKRLRRCRLIVAGRSFKAYDRLQPCEVNACGTRSTSR